MQRAAVALGADRVTVAYPQGLAAWFDALVEPDTGDADVTRWVRIDVDEPESYRVTASTGRWATGLDLGDALAAFWDSVTFQLIDRLADAIALHAAAVRRGNDLVLLPGPSGAGKTRLALWYQAQGFALATDEVVTVSLGPDPADANGLESAALRRPLFLKGPEDAGALLGGNGLATLRSSLGTMGWIAGAGQKLSRPIGPGMIVFPRYLAGTPFVATPLTPAQAGLGLLEHCVNVRNLPRGGLALASALARRVPALALSYGETGQLTGTLDVLTRQVLAAAPGQDDFAALCAAFTARAASRAAPAVTGPFSATAAPTRPSRSSVPAPTVARFARRLTVGMATYDDYDGVFFTIQSIRTHHPELAGALEFVVIDNHPGGPCSQPLKALEKWIDGYRYVPRGDRSGTAVRDAVFAEASSELVLCVDSHVLIVSGALSRLIDYLEAAPGTRDLIQGPLLYDDLRTVATHFEPRWQGGMYGVWASDARGLDSCAPPFDIPMQGLGLFACRRAAWPGFNHRFRGFGGEEGYIHEKVRRLGGRTLCLPFLRWVHRFARPLGLPYPNCWEDRIRNYLIGFTELGLDTAAMEAHFAELLGAEAASRIVAATRLELAF
jgi:hypothetical protein